VLLLSVGELQPARYSKDILLELPGHCMQGTHSLLAHQCAFSMSRSVLPPLLLRLLLPLEGPISCWGGRVAPDTPLP
jgi:hypothetical protein